MNWTSFEYRRKSHLQWHSDELSVCFQLIRPAELIVSTAFHFSCHQQTCSIRNMAQANHLDFYVESCPWEQYGSRWLLSSIKIPADTNIARIQSVSVLATPPDRFPLCSRFHCYILHTSASWTSVRSISWTNVIGIQWKTRPPCIRRTWWKRPFSLGQSKGINDRKVSRLSLYLIWWCNCTIDFHCIDRYSPTWLCWVPPFCLALLGRDLTWILRAAQQHCDDRTCRYRPEQRTTMRLYLRTVTEKSLGAYRRRHLNHWSTTDEIELDAEWMIDVWSNLDFHYHWTIAHLFSWQIKRRSRRVFHSDGLWSTTDWSRFPVDCWCWIDGSHVWCSSEDSTMWKNLHCSALVRRLWESAVWSKFSNWGTGESLEQESRWPQLVAQRFAGWFSFFLDSSTFGRRCSTSFVAHREGEKEEDWASPPRFSLSLSLFLDKGDGGYLFSAEEENTEWKTRSTSPTPPTKAC